MLLNEGHFIKRNKKSNTAITSAIPYFEIINPILNCENGKAIVSYFNKYCIFLKDLIAASLLTENLEESTLNLLTL